MLAQYDGRLCLWDWLRRHHEPLLTMQVCDAPLLAVRGHEAVSISDQVFILYHVYNIHCIKYLQHYNLHDSIL